MRERITDNAKSREKRSNAGNAGIGIKDNLFLIPSERFDELTRPDSCAESAGYIGICAILSFLLMSLSLFYLYYSESSNMLLSLNYAIFDAGLGVAILLLMFLVFVVLIHGASLILGAKKTINKTFQVHAYSFTPSFLLGWVYVHGSSDSLLGMAFIFTGLLFSLVAAVNGMNGLQRVHRLSLFRSFIAEFFVPITAYITFGIIIAMYGKKLGLVG